MALSLAADNTFLNAIKPVGEQIPISFVAEGVVVPAASSIEYNYDFLINRNYALSSLKVSKTVVSSDAAVVQTVGVYKVEPGADAVALQTQIAQVGFALAAVKGTTVIGGALSAGAAIAVPGANPATDNANADLAVTDAFYNGVVADELTKVAANYATPGSDPSMQRIRVRIRLTTVAIEEQTCSASCFILIGFSGYSDTRPSGAEELVRIAA